MQQLVDTMHFKGRAAPSETSPGGMHVLANAASCSITTVLNNGGVTGGFDPAAVTNAVFESEVKLVTPATFVESGTITFGDAGHRLNFTTAAEGWMGQSPDPALKQGTVTWTVAGG